MPCVLTQREVGRLVHYRLLPNHDEHRHVSYREATELVAGGTMFIVDDEKGFISGSTIKHWAPRASGGMMVLQMVDV